MITYYKSVRYIDGKIRWVIEDENGALIRYPSKEQLKLAIIDDPKSTVQYQFLENFAIHTIQE